MELQSTERCILCNELINAHVNIPTSTCGISTMKIKIADHKQCKKLYSQYMKLKFRENVVKNTIADKILEIEYFLKEKEFKDKNI
ncbi:hypothetical protein EBU24_03835 [bacterium]|nr:hypothetical protein [bacterium]